MSSAESAGGCGILVVDDDEVLASTLTKLLRKTYPRVWAANSGIEAVAILEREASIRVMLVDLVMPVMDGLGVLDHVRRHHPQISVVLMTGFGTIETAVAAIKRGAEDFLTKPFDGETALKKVEQLAGLYRLEAEIAAGAEGEKEPPYAGIVAASPVMRRVVDRARAAGRSAAPVLIVGETGTGKEMLARAIHEASPRSSRPFVAVNGAALPPDLIESELFGYRRGAFTGAADDHAGLFEAAHSGTLFLDEIGDLPLASQAKLLRVLETGEVRRVGSTSSNRVDVRLLSATNRPLPQLRGPAMREDLFFRISTIILEIPPLRQRRADIGPLVSHFLSQLSGRYGRAASLDKSALDRLFAYVFPGNVRELYHIIESVIAVSSQNPQVITERDLAGLVRSQPGGYELPEHVTAGVSLQAMEKFAIKQALRIAGQNKSRAAELLGLSRGPLYSKLKEYGLDANPAEKSRE